MKLEQVLLSAALLGTLCGCDGEPENQAFKSGELKESLAGQPPAGAGPFASEEPRWKVEAPPELHDSCFGASVALGDFNGDGHADLAVAAPPCNGFSHGKVVLYPGTSKYFSREPIIAELDWRSPIPFAPGRHLEVSTADVDGDRFADLLVSSRYGALVFRGGSELDTFLQSPSFRVPVTSPFKGASRGDFNGDGLDDIVTLQGSSSSHVYLSTPGAAGSAPSFQLSRTLTASSVRVLGDTNGDGAEDLLVTRGADSRLYRGCQEASSGCEGGLAAQPTWSIAGTVAGIHRDVNDDGLAELFLAEGGRLRLHLSEGEGVSTLPTWTALGDPLFLGFGSSIIPVGDFDKDGRDSDFVVRAGGRIYLYFPEKGFSSELRPAWAWPGSDAAAQGPEWNAGHAVAPAGDLDGDGYADLLVGLTPASPGKVMVLGGGKVLPTAPAPYLPESGNCGPFEPEGTPELTVDEDMLARSFVIEHRSFDATSCEYAKGCVLGTGERRLLRFGVSVVNLGTGPVSLPTPTQAPELYEFDACYQDYRLQGFASYELRDARGDMLLQGRTQGYKLADTAAWCADAPAPSNPFMSQGISPGWADVTPANVSCQWLDITDVPDGMYTVRVGVDAKDIIVEKDVMPNTAQVSVRLEGDEVRVIR